MRFVFGAVLGLLVASYTFAGKFAEQEKRYNNLLVSWKDLADKRDDEIRKAYLLGSQQVRALKEVEDAVHRQSGS